MTTFMKTNLKKSDGQTNIDKYRVAVHSKLKDINKAKRLSIQPLES